MSIFFKPSEKKIIKRIVDIKYWSLQPGMTNGSMSSLKNLLIHVKIGVNLPHVWHNGGDQNVNGGFGRGKVEPLFVGYHGQYLKEDDYFYNEIGVIRNLANHLWVLCA